MTETTEALKLARRHAVVTGAASGIGRAVALELGRRGARLSLVDIDGDGAARTAEAVRQLGAAARAFTVDLGDRERIDAFAREVGDDPVDVLVSNAGVAVVAPFVATELADWDWISAVNLWGPVHLARTFLPSMIERRSGHLAFVASLAGLVGAPGMVAYSTTKFALVGFAESLRHELQGTGVGTTVLCPGYVRTGLHRATRYGNEGFRRFLDRSPAWYGMAPEAVASSLVEAMVSRRALVVLGPEKIGWWLKRLAPEVAFAVSQWVARRTGTVGASGG